MSEHTALSAAQDSLVRKLGELLVTYAGCNREYADSGHDPQAAVRMALALDARCTSVKTGIDLLHYEAQRELEAQKEAAAVVSEWMP
jgi:hypothetical protein